MGTQLQKSYDDADEVNKLYKQVRNNSRVILYTDVMGRPDEDGQREQVSRDDMWAISTSELNAFKALIHSREIEAEKRGHKDGYYRGVNDFSGWYMDASLAAQRHPILPEIAKDLLDNYQPPIYRPLKEQTEGGEDESA